MVDGKKRKQGEGTYKSTSIRFYDEEYCFLQLRLKEVQENGYPATVSGYFSYLVDKDIEENPGTKKRSDERLELFRVTQKRRKAMYGKRNKKPEE